METDTYICSKCKIEKPISEFGKAKDRSRGHKSQCNKCCKEYRIKNKEAISARNKVWASKNKDVIKLKSKEYYRKNKIKIDSDNKKWRLNNKERAKELSDNFYKANREDIIKRNVINNKNKVDNNELYKLSMSIRCNIRQCFYKKSHKKKSNTANILGCSFETFKNHIESQFEDWMTWDNYGMYNGEFNYGWDLDHIIPISTANTEEDVIKLNHYTNFQPLCSHTNRNIKKDKLNWKTA